MRFRVLGSLECRDGHEQVRIGGPVHERVCVTLLLEPGRVLPVSRLVDAVWGEEAPATATHQVRKAVAELRQRIPGGRELIVTDGPGYRAMVPRDDLDLGRFTGGLEQARAAVAAGRTAEAVALLREALSLWRGPLLAGRGGPVIEAASRALEERRLAATEQLFELRLASGESAALVGEVREFVAGHPLRENLRGHLMLALYRSGRQAEALEEYAAVRELLVEELGIGPGPALQKLHQDILRNSPELAAPAEQPAAAPSTPPAPGDEPRTTLPYDLRDFTGREGELKRLLDFVRDAEQPGPLIVAIDGMGGSGKTSLAVRAAHRLADRYPDAQLCVDLHGFTPGAQPLAPAAAAEALLRMLGVPAERIPDDGADRLQLWRNLLAKRRILVLLDNAVDEAQVRPLIGASPDTLVLITSRVSLVDLDAAHAVSLGTMSPRDGAALVAEVIGAERAAAEPEAVRELTDLCGQLPLALRIAAARLRKRARWTVRYLVDRLRDDTYRLAELSAGERSVEVTLRLSYEGLGPELRKAFPLLGRHPGAELGVHTAAALLGSGTREAEDVLEDLLDVHLMQQQEPGRYIFHDLVRSFAQSLSRTAGGEESEETAEAVLRLLDYCLAATDAACDVLFPGRDRAREREAEPAQGLRTELPRLDSPEQARAWFDQELEMLLAVLALAYRNGHHRRGALLARNVVFHLDLRGRFEQFRAVSAGAVAASRRLGDEALLRPNLSNLSVAYWKLGRFEEGITAAEEALELAVRRGDRHGKAKDTGVLGLLLMGLGRFDEALPRLRRSIALKRELGAVRAEAESLGNLSELYREWGRYAEAAEAALAAVELDRSIGAEDKEVSALADLAFARLDLGEYEAAADALARARELAADVASPAVLAVVLALSAEAADRLGEPERALAQAERALETAAQSETPLREAVVANVVGRLFGRRGEHDRALRLHRQACRSAGAARYRAEGARALVGMAEAYEGLGDPEAAARCREGAAEAFEAMGVPESARAGSERASADRVG
ncbi:BTAD domain-containing putative transcriptional regulator [Streptomyces sp. JJ36]|uniref:AfsR/SARP family transcriptional regulator n=1 Tax=Streptomyces sp. JJ36 TaxID=2736645 RepID=UPI001F347488|nr:BTAD domain-containing putative transcriptional regulator [Streptomyces sp. JJ36]